MPHEIGTKIKVTKFPNPRYLGEIGRIEAVQPYTGSYTIRLDNPNLPLVKVYDTEIEVVLDI